jgi:hypothetical protein
VKEVVSLVRQSPMQILVTLSLGLFVLGLTFYIALLLLLVAGSWTSSVTAAGAGRLPAEDLGNMMAGVFFSTIAGFNPMLNDPFMRGVVPSDPAGNLGGILFALLTAVFVFTLFSIPMSLVNGLGAAIYLSVNPTAVPPTQPAPQPVAPPPPQPINVPQP